MEALKVSAIDTHLSNNTKDSSDYSKGDLPMPPGMGIAIVACMGACLMDRRLYCDQQH
jgi:hypothetical protein